MSIEEQIEVISTGSSPLLAEKEVFAISKCEDKTQLVVEIYEAVRKIRDKYEDWILDNRSNDSLHGELYQLSEAVAPCYKDPGQFNRNVNDAVTTALALCNVHLASKHKGIDVSRIINSMRLNRDDKTTKGDSSDEYR